MFEGRSSLVLDGKEYGMNSGDVLTVFPNQIHGYKTTGHEDYFITIFPPEFLPEFKDVFSSKIPLSPIIHTDNKNQLLIKLIDSILALTERDIRYKEQIFKGLLLAFFGEVFSGTEFKSIDNRNIPVINTILNYCNENYRSNITVEKLSDDLHISKYYVSRLFNDKLKIGFNDYVNSLRIADACEMLKGSDLDITEISQNCGFNSTRTFNRAFMKDNGMTPSQYRDTSYGKTNKQ